MGELLGSTNATKANSRNVPAHSYRGCLSIGAQPGHTGVIFNDTTGGLPQRFLWAPTTDPDMPAERSADPDPLDTSLPSWTPGTNGVVEISYGPPEIADTIISAHLARQRGDGEALDGHWMLTRCKVGALLAVMHHRSVVSEQDWELAAMVMEVSDTTRQALLDHASQADQANIRGRAIRRAESEEFYENSRALTVRNSLLRMLERDGEQSGSELRRRLGTREKRDLFDQVISLLASDGIVVEIPGEQRGLRYRLSGHGDQGGHPQYSQLNSGDQGGHGDQSYNVTELDSRRSHGGKVSCAKWFDQYIAKHQASGRTTVESFAVLDAGEAAGYSRGNVSVAANQHPGITVAARKGNGRTIWLIEADQPQNGQKQAL
jgi:hypothetical protein